jgi:hypothetical protein
MKYPPIVDQITLPWLQGQQPRATCDHRAKARHNVAHGGGEVLQPVLPIADSHLAVAHLLETAAHRLANRTVLGCAP